MVVRGAGTLVDQDALVDLLAEVWDTDRHTIVPLPLLRAIEHAGNWAVAVERDGELVGGGFGYLGTDADGHVHLHSHIVGFVPGDRGRGAGFATKLHQRAWCLERGIDTVTWTFDPLVRANAGFNLVKLAATAPRYLTDHYGDMPDGVNAGDPSDRLLASWHLRVPRVEDAADGRAGHADRERLLTEGASVVLDVDAEGRPVAREAPDGTTALVATPPDIVTLREQDRELALRWRHAVRDTLGAAIDDGWHATSLTRDGSYVLERAPARPSRS